MRFRAKLARAKILAPAVPVLLGLGLAGCGGLEPVATTEPITDPTQAYAMLMLDKHAITLSTVAPYDTTGLVATPRTLVGEPMAGLSAPTFTSSDTTIVTVTPEGMLQAVRPGAAVKVIARLNAVGNISHADTAYIYVDASSPPRLASLSIHPVPPDSAFLNAWDFGNSPDFTLVFGTPILSSTEFRPSIATVNAIDSNGNTMAGLKVELRLLDPLVGGLTAPSEKKIIATVGDYAFPLAFSPGVMRIAARTTAYGITMVDTVTWRVAYPIYSKVDIGKTPDGQQAFFPSRLTIATSGFVNWVNFIGTAAAGDSIDVTYDDPTHVAQPGAVYCQPYVDYAGVDYGYDPGPHCQAGNIVVPGPGGPVDDPVYAALWNSQLQQFPVAGVYRFRSVRTGATGQITVVDPPAVP